MWNRFFAYKIRNFQYFLKRSTDLNSLSQDASNDVLHYFFAIFLGVPLFFAGFLVFGPKGTLFFEIRKKRSAIPPHFFKAFI